MLKIENIENKIINSFFVFIILILFEGLLCQPWVNYIIRRQVSLISWESNDNLPFNFCSNNIFFSNFWDENGLIENFQSLFLAISIFFLIRTKRKLINKKSLINFFFLIQIIGLIYYLGEEISWGQHFFNWSSPEFFVSYNNQMETNIHNISNIFDQLPRTIVLLWCGLSVPTILLLTKISINIKINKKIFDVVCPSKKLLYISLILLLFAVPDLILDKLNLYPESSTVIKPFFNSSYFYQLISFNFIRLSELHELIFSFYFFYYSYCISKNTEKLIN